MRWIRRLMRRARILLQRERVEREMDEEIRFHIEMETAERVREGLSPEEARREALRAFGGVDRYKEEARDARGVRPLEDLVQDLRYGLRTLRRSPLFTLVALLTLALGIGANTAIFSVVNTVLLRPLPYEEPERLALIWGHMSETSVERAPLSGPDTYDLRERSRVFEGFAGAFGASTTLTDDQAPVRVTLGWATTNLFSLLGADAALGRTFVPEDRVDMDPGVWNDPTLRPPPAPAMLSYGLWQRRYGGDPDVIGRTIRVNSQPLHIIGVAPRGFRLHVPADAAMPREIDLWSPVPNALNIGPRDAQWLTVVGRLRPGATWTQARAELHDLAAQLRAEHQFHANVGMDFDVQPMHADIVRHVEPILLALLGAVGFVLLIACANVANLLLIRAGTREREIAIRTALGGGRGRIARQLLTESGLLALAGGALGLLIALGGIELLLALRPENLPRVDDVAIDARVLAFVAAISILSALLFGAAPAVHASKPDVAESLKERARFGGLGSRRLRDLLVVGEVALSLVLLIGAGLMLRSFASLQRVDPGFQAQGVLTVNVAPPFFKYRTPDERVAFFRRVHDRFERLPGVEAVGAVAPLPLSGGGQFWFGPYALTEAEDEWSRNEGDYRLAMPGLLDALDIRLIRGRGLTEADNEADARRVVVIDEKMAERAWPESDNAVGRRLLVMRPATTPGETGFQRYWAEVVGVVEHVRYDDLRRDGRETIYFPVRDWSFTEMSFTLRTAADPAGLAGAVRRAVEEADPEVAASEIRPLQAYVDDALASTRFVLVLITVFAGVALVLAAVGLYGVISYSVRQRTAEIGVRMAFGAEAGRILRMVLGQGLILTLLGVGLGLVGAFLLTDALASQLFGVHPTDPITFAVIAGLLTGIALAACYLPARRATRVDPMVALRAE